MSDRIPLLIAVLFIAAAAVGNLIRALWNIPVMIGSFLLPGWTGALIFIALGLLSAWAFKALLSLYFCRGNQQDL